MSTLTLVPSPCTKRTMHDDDGSVPLDGSATLDGKVPLLDALQLDQLEAAFRRWAKGPVPSHGRKDSRRRIFLIFLLIRYTGAKLSEVLAFGPDVVGDDTVTFAVEGQPPRCVEISQALSRELRELATSLETDGDDYVIDPAYVRRKFYDMARRCGFERRQGGPEMLRKARALELMQNNVPLPAVQRMMGRPAPPLTAAATGFSERDLQEATRSYVEREGSGRTSARNRFMGKVSRLCTGDVQTLVELATVDGGTLRSIITNESAERLGLKPGMLVSAEVKAPWLTIEPAGRPGASSADNERKGVISRIVRGSVATECIVTVSPTLVLCAVVPAEQFDALGLDVGNAARLSFGSLSVILHVD
ncbi:MAG: TOBE domain-containing protein [Desulfovibrio sp.]|nr:TOBE domain-containing protein [Desulfovibrio sp.]